MTDLVAASQRLIGLMVPGLMCVTGGSVSAHFLVGPDGSIGFSVRREGESAKYDLATPSEVTAGDAAMIFSRARSILDGMK